MAYTTCMLYIYYGSNVQKARAKVRATTHRMLAKNPNALSLRITDENFADFDLAELVQAQALFKNEYIVFLDNLLVEDLAHASILKFLTEIAESSNIFFILEENIDAKILEKLENVAKNIQKFEITTKQQSKTHTFNIFSLADALGDGNKKKLWILFCKAKFAGVSSEEIHGVLFWVVKSMLLTFNIKSAEEAGMKPFVFSKANRFATKRTKQELATLIDELIKIPHESRRNNIPLNIGIERFILSS